jgi:hypothetical protein
VAQFNIYHRGLIATIGLRPQRVRQSLLPLIHPCHDLLKKKRTPVPKTTIDKKAQLPPIHISLPSFVFYSSSSLSLTHTLSLLSPLFFPLFVLLFLPLLTNPVLVYQIFSIYTSHTTMKFVLCVTILALVVSQVMAVVKECTKSIIVQCKLSILSMHAKKEHHKVAKENAGSHLTNTDSFLTNDTRTHTHTHFPLMKTSTEHDMLRRRKRLQDYP